MIGEQERHHGVVLARLVRGASPYGADILLRGQQRSSYVVGGRVALYVKYSTRRLSPWSFSFTQAHQVEVAALGSTFDCTFVVLVCGDDGIACLSLSEFNSLLDDNFEPTEWLKAARGRRQRYTVTGTDNRQGIKVGDSEFPAKVLASLFAEQTVEDVAMPDQAILDLVPDAPVSDAPVSDAVPGSSARFRARLRAWLRTGSTAGPV